MTLCNMSIELGARAGMIAPDETTIAWLRGRPRVPQDEAGAECRLPGCSMCIAINGDLVSPGQLAVSTSNRNFEGRQGPGTGRADRAR